MRYRTLGGTGIEVSVHCLGAMMFGAVGNPDHDDCVNMGPCGPVPSLISARWDALPPRLLATAFAGAVPRLRDAVDTLDGAERRELRPFMWRMGLALQVR